MKDKRFHLALVALVLLLLFSSPLEAQQATVPTTVRVQSLSRCPDGLWPDPWFGCYRYYYPEFGMAGFVDGAGCRCYSLVGPCYCGPESLLGRQLRCILWREQIAYQNRLEALQQRAESQNWQERALTLQQRYGDSVRLLRRDSSPWGREREPARPTLRPREPGIRGGQPRDLEGRSMTPRQRPSRISESPRSAAPRGGEGSSRPPSSGGGRPRGGN